jgi:hypothetical protein
VSKQEEEDEMVEEIEGRRYNEGVWISSHLFLCFIRELSACALEWGMSQFIKMRMRILIDYSPVLLESLVLIPGKVRYLVWYGIIQTRGGGVFATAGR